MGHPAMMAPQVGGMQPEGYYNQLPQQTFYHYPTERLSPGMQGQILMPMGFSYEEMDEVPELKGLLQKHREEQKLLYQKQQEELKQFQRVHPTPMYPPQAFLYHQQMTSHPFYPFQSGLVPQGYPMQQAFAMQQDPGMYNMQGVYPQGRVPLMSGQIQGPAGGPSTTSGPSTLTNASSMGHMIPPGAVYYGKRGSITQYTMAPGYGRVEMSSAGLPPASTAQLPPTPTRLNKSESFAGLSSSGLIDSSGQSSVAQSARQRSTTFPSLADAAVVNAGIHDSQQALSDPAIATPVDTVKQPAKPMCYVHESGGRPVLSPTPSEGSLSDAQERLQSLEAEELPAKSAETSTEAKPSTKKSAFTRDQFKMAEIAKAPLRTAVTESEKISLNQLRKNRVQQDLQSNITSGRGTGRGKAGQQQ